MTTVSPATNVIVASNAEDATAAEAVKQHHAELSGRLAAHAEALLTAAGSSTETPDRSGFEQARRAAVSFCTTDLVPHALAEEDTLYPTAAKTERARLLVESMIAEHRVITGLVEELTQATEPVRSAAAAGALRVLFDTHLAKENDLVLPILAGDPAVSLAGILSGMHELLGGHPDHDHGDSGHSCGCGESDAGDVPELDVRMVPHAIRHATVFGAFDAIPAGGSLLLVAPHDPIPLLQQLLTRAGGQLTISYEERGPEAWRLRLTRA